MEVWDLYDVNRQKTGETCFRGCTLPDGRFHLVVNVCVFNDQGAMLIQQRQSSKVPYHDLWALSSGGSAIAGETSAMAASRELQEEIGGVSDEFPLFFMIRFAVDEDIVSQAIRRAQFIEQGNGRPHAGRIRFFIGQG